MLEELDRDPLIPPGGETPEPPDTPPAPEDEPPDEGEPGGAEPQAVRARKEYRRRIQLQKDLQTERERAIAAEARADALAESRDVAAPPAPPDKPAFQIYSDEQVSQAIDQGVISPLQASSYLAKREAYLAQQESERIRREETAQTQRETTTREIEQKAATELAAYTKVYPTLHTGEHPRWSEIQAAYTDLRSRGLPESLTTQALAVRLVLGPVETAIQREETTRMARERQASDFHSEGGGGSTAEPRNGGDPLAKVPQRYKEFWKKMGYTRQQMEAEAKFIPAERMK